MAEPEVRRQPQREDLQRAQSAETNAEEEMELKYGAKNLLQLMMPVTVCMILVVANLLTVPAFGANEGTYLPYVPFHEEGDISGGTKFGQAIVNTIIVVCIFAAVTFLVVLLYYYECYCFLYGYLFFASLMLLAGLGFVYVAQVIKESNTYVDLITISLVMFNLSVAGMLAIFWKSPLVVQQVALVASCVMVASAFLQYLPVWTAWVLLAGMALYDLAAVLCPYGPLKLLVNIATTRNEGFLQSLIYSSTMMWTVTMADLDVDDDEDGEARSNQGISHIESCTTGGATTDGEEEEEESGAKLGLGDFIFYSILVGRATIDSNGDWNIILGCVLAILIGLALTLLLLAIFKQALPALPISITLGLITYFASQYAITPFTNQLHSSQVFI
ncbi:presenilin-2-like [Sycon ciliatum]|uniref:presenilin-2-like n=1 Tax=Sycon ciliatum TaxID=27933 RepID=UPI0020AC4A69|eukprot:scpid66505/ scgid24414/ Presenilin-2; Pre2